ncbi:MAG: hypothetical protein K2L66_05185, partial [Paramuribaculum sp.]|nr:hypothetical protein [Paramuribaculum sp.]
MEFNMKADSRAGGIYYMTGIDQDFKPITNKTYDLMNTSRPALYPLAGLKKQDLTSQPDPVTITFNYDNCLARELWQNSDDKSDTRFDELAGLTTHIFDGGYTG